MNYNDPDNDEEFEDIDLEEDEALISLSSEELKIYIGNLDKYISDPSARNRVLIVDNTSEFMDSVKKIGKAYYEKDTPKLLEIILNKLMSINLRIGQDGEFKKMIEEAIEETKSCLKRLNVAYEEPTKEAYIKEQVDKYLQSLILSNKKPSLIERKTTGIDLTEESKSRLMEELKAPSEETLHPEFLKKWEEADKMIREELQANKSKERKYELSDKETEEKARRNKLEEWVTSWIQYEKIRQKERF